MSLSQFPHLYGWDNNSTRLIQSAGTEDCQSRVFRLPIFPPSVVLAPYAILPTTNLEGQGPRRHLKEPGKGLKWELLVPL